MQKRCESSALAMVLWFFCIKISYWDIHLTHVIMCYSVGCYGQSLTFLSQYRRWSLTILVVQLEYSSTNPSIPWLLMLLVIPGARSSASLVLSMQDMIEPWPSSALQALHALWTEVLGIIFVHSYNTYALYTWWDYMPELSAFPVNMP